MKFHVGVLLCADGDKGNGVKGGVPHPATPGLVKKAGLGNYLPLKSSNKGNLTQM